MLFVIIALIIVASVLLWGIILIQNPKGGGLSSQFGGGVSNIIGARQSVDFMEKATWIMAVSVVALVLFTNVFTTTPSIEDGTGSKVQDRALDAGPVSAPANDAPAQGDGEAIPFGEENDPAE